MSEMPTMGDLPAMEALDESAGLGEVVNRVNANTAAIYQGIEVLRQIANSYAAALPESRNDRKALHEGLDAMGRSVTALAKTAADAVSAANAAADKAAGVSSAVAQLAVKQVRAASAPVPAVTNVLTTTSVDVTVTWPLPWPDATYTVLPVIEAPASLLGKVGVSVKSKKTESAVLTVSTSAVLTAGAATVRAVSVP